MGMDRKKCGYTGLRGHGWLSFSIESPQLDLRPRTPSKRLPLFVVEGLPEVDLRDEMLVWEPRISRLFIAMAWSGEAVSNAAAKHLGVLIWTTTSDYTRQRLPTNNMIAVI